MMSKEAIAMNASGHTTLSERQLLTFVRYPIPAPIQDRYSALIERRQAEVLTPEEHEELLELTDQIEQIDAQRAEYLVSLARMRRVPVSQLVTDLGIDDPSQHG
jgi:hypothetical protein